MNFSDRLDKILSEDLEPEVDHSIGALQGRISKMWQDALLSIGFKPTNISGYSGMAKYESLKFIKEYKNGTGYAAMRTFPDDQISEWVFIWQYKTKDPSFVVEEASDIHSSAEVDNVKSIDLTIDKLWDLCERISETREIAETQAEWGNDYFKYLITIERIQDIKTYSLDDTEDVFADDDEEIGISLPRSILNNADEAYEYVMDKLSYYDFHSQDNI